MIKDIFQKEYTIAEILQKTWKVFATNFKQIAIITLIVYIPINIFLAFFPTERFILNYGQLEGFKIYLNVIKLFETTVGILATAAIAYIVKDWLEKNRQEQVEITETLKWNTAIKKSLAIWPKIIVTSILLSLFLFGLFLLLIIPGAIYSVYWSFTIYVVIFYNKLGKKAMDHSKAIIEGRWWKTIGYLFIFSFLMLAVSFAMEITEGFLLNLLLPRGLFSHIIETILDSGINVMLTYFTVVHIVFFINFDSTKVLKEESEAEVNSIILEENPMPQNN